METEADDDEDSDLDGVDADDDLTTATDSNALIQVKETVVIRDIVHRRYTPCKMLMNGHGIIIFSPYQ